MENPQRIAKALSRAGIASRRDAERIVLAGRVTLNGKTIDSPATKVTARDRIEVDGRPASLPDRTRLWKFFKPAGVVTTDKDERGRKTVLDLMPGSMPRVMTVGRLDLNSEGLLLLTNDGELKRHLELPSTGWTRKYRARAKGKPSEAVLDRLRKGAVIGGERLRPMRITVDRIMGANAWLTVSLREGRNREVRRALETAGLSVNRLIRVSYGPFQLGEIKPGETLEISRRALRDQLGPKIAD